MDSMNMTPVYVHDSHEHTHAIPAKAHCLGAHEAKLSREIQSRN